MTDARLVTHSIDEARDHLARVFASHGLQPQGRARRLDFRHEHAALADLSFNQVQYGAQVTVDAPALTDFYLLQFTLRGTCEIICGGDSVLLPRGTLLVMNPTRPYRKRWSADCRQLILRLEKALVDREVASVLGRPVTRPVEFELAPLESAAVGGSLTRLVAALWHDLAEGGLRHPPVQHHLAQSVAALMLATVNHSYRPLYDSAASPAAPRFVRRAEEFISAHAGEALTPETIAQAAGVSARTLHRGFQQFRDTTPMAWVRAARLDQVRERLLAGDAESVTDAAGACGLTHLSRFARDYRHRFGETPSETLRGRRPNRK